MEGLIYNIQRYSVQDGPGVRTTVFFKGCPLRCHWCANPESQSSLPEVAHRDSLCNRCGDCLAACNRNAISLSEKGIKIDRRLCDNCGNCVPACNTDALIIYGRNMSIQEILEEVLRDRIYYRNSGGGITASGGEPCLQAEFLSSFFEQCQKKGLHTTLDTCGYVPSDTFAKVLRYTDLVLYDIKHMDSNIHKLVTGFGNELILDNVATMEAMKIPFVLRVPLIPTIDDAEEDIRAAAEFATRWRSVKGVDLLPYHRLGITKYDMLDRRFELNGLECLKQQQIEQAKEIVESYNLTCEVGG